MRLELRGAADGDVVARVDHGLPGGEIVRDGGELRVGFNAALGTDGIRQSAALAARSLRRTGGIVAWRLDDGLDVPAEEQVRALVEGTAFGAYDPGLRKRDYAARPELVLALDAPESLRALAERQTVVARHVDGARNLANLPPNELTPVALAAYAQRLDHGLSLIHI